MAQIINKKARIFDLLGQSIDTLHVINHSCPVSFLYPLGNFRKLESIFWGYRDETLDKNWLKTLQLLVKDHWNFIKAVSKCFFIYLFQVLLCADRSM